MAAGFTVPASFKAVDRMTAPLKKMGAATQSFAARAQRAFARAQRRARAFRQSVSNVNSKIFNMKNAAGVLAAAGAAKGLKSLSDKTATYADEIAKSSRQLGIQNKELQKLQFTAERAGVSKQMLNKSLESLGKRMGELKNESGSLYSHLEKAGKTALINQLKQTETTTESLKVMAEHYKNIEGEQNKANFAAKAFSKTNMKMQRVFQQGSGGIDELGKKYEKFGFILGDKAGKKAEQYKDAQTNMNTAIEAARMEIGMKLMPIVSGYMKSLTEWITNNRELIKQKAAEWVAKLRGWIANLWVMLKSFISTMRVVINVIWYAIEGFLFLIRPIIWLVSLFTSSSEKGKGLSSTMQTLGTVLGIVTGAIIAMNVASKAMLVIQGIVKVATAIWTAAQWALNVALNANPIGLVVAAIVILIGVIYAVVKFVQSAIANFKSWGAIILWLMGPIGWIIILIKTIVKHWENIKSAFTDKGIIAGLKAIGVAILDAILYPIQKILETVALLPSWLGGGAAESAAKGIEGLRKRIGAVNEDLEETNKKADEMEKKKGGPGGPPGGVPALQGQGSGGAQGGGIPQINPRQTQQQGQMTQAQQFQGAMDVEVREQGGAKADVKPSKRGNIPTRVRKKSTTGRFMQKQKGE